MGGIRYCVLFTKVLKQWEVSEAIRKRLPDGAGTVFYPCAELWMGSLGRTVVEPLFPGYVFVRSGMSRNALHEFLRERRREVLSFIKELHASQERTFDGEGFSDDESLTDLSAGEAELMDFLLGLHHTLEAGGPEGVRPGTGAGRAGGPEGRHPEAGTGKAQGEEAAGESGRNGKRIRPRKLPSCGVVAMSHGYREKDGRYVVADGPLKGHEGHIVDVSIRDRRAYLDLKVGGRPARAGLEIRSRRVWHPEDKEAPALLGDGAEVNLKELAAAMMRGRA